MLMTRMGWFQSFANGILFPVFMVAFGLLLVLQAPFLKEPTPEQIEAAPAWMHWLLRRHTEKVQRKGGWMIIGFSVLIVVFRIMQSHELATGGPF